jgi:hypothetical protein
MIMNMNFKKHLCWAAAVLLISVVVFSGIMQARALDAPFADMYDSNYIYQNSSFQLEQYTANTQVSAGDGMVDRFIVKYKASETNRRIQDIATVSITEAYNLDASGSLECIVLDEKVNPADLAAVLKAAGMSPELEYIQPDFVLFFAGLGLSYRESGDDEEAETGTESLNEEEEDSLPEEELTEEELLLVEEPLLEEFVQAEEVIENEIERAPAFSSNGEMTVALIDSAINLQHPALTKFFVEGWNFVDGTPDAGGGGQFLESVHGTHIAGIIATNSVGKVKIMPLQVFTEQGAYTSDIIEAIIYAEAQGARVANCSFGSGQDNRALREVMECSDMLFVAAAGNNAGNLDNSPLYPAAFGLDNVISVAALNTDRGFSYFSNYSSTLVDIAARGRDVQSSMLGRSYGPLSGTSMSAAAVSGAAGWLWSENPGLSAAEVKERLCSTGDRLAHLQSKVKEGRSLNTLRALAGTEQTGIVSISYEEDTNEQGYAGSPQDNWLLFATSAIDLPDDPPVSAGPVKQALRRQSAPGSRSGNSKTVHGYVWPMVIQDLGIGSSFLALHEITVELRSTFSIPANAGLCATVIEVESSPIAGLGEFTIENIPLETYVLYIKRPGYLTRCMMVTVVDSDPDIIELEPPGVEDDGVFNLWWGDCNGDLSVNNNDAMMIFALMALDVDAFDPLYDAACDLNGDGRIDGLDMMMVFERSGYGVKDYAGTEGVDFGDGTTITINAVGGKKYDVALSASGISSFGGIEIRVTYDPNVLDLTDLCAFSGNKELSSGPVAAAGITITQVSPGEIKFIVDKNIPVGQIWSGVLNSMSFTALQTDTTVVTVDANNNINSSGDMYSIVFDGDPSCFNGDYYYIDVNSTDTVYICAEVQDDLGNTVPASIVYASDSGVANSSGEFTLDELEIGAWGEYPTNQTYVTATATFGNGAVVYEAVSVEAIAISPKK